MACYQKKNDLIVEAVVCHHVSHSIPFCSHFFTCKCSFLSHLASSTLSVLYPYQDSSHIVLLSRRSCSFGSIEFISSWTPAAHRWGRCWKDQLKALDLELTVSWVGQPTSSPCTYTTRVESLVLHQLTHPVLQLVISRASSPALMPSGPAHPCPHHQGQLYCPAQIGCRALSPECYSLWGAGPALPLLWPQGQLSCLQMAKGKREGKDISPSPTHRTTDKL